ncbi:MAG: S8 family serine peptidase [Bacteroidota bacterium]
MQADASKANRYVVVLSNHASDSEIVAAQQALDCAFTHSSDLNKNLKAQQVYDQGKAVYFQYLDAAVLEGVDPDRLAAAVRSDSPVLHFEAERIFRPVGPLEQLEAIKATLANLQNQILDLEQVLSATNSPTLEPVVEPRPGTWGLNVMGLSRTAFTGKGVAVAVLDTGIFRNHPDFRSVNIKGKSFVQNGEWDGDANGHGTHCAGTICGDKSDQNGRYYSVAPEVDLFVGQVLDRVGNGLTSGLIDGIDWALSKNCRIISLSLGAEARPGFGPSPLFERIGQRALERNCLIIAAAGNESQRSAGLVKPVNSPADAKSIMAVAALNRRLSVADFSNAGINDQTGGGVDLAAPGVDIYSAYSMLAPGGELYRSQDGTSMAVPHVAGLAALYMQRFPDLSAEEIWQKLTSNAQQLDRQEAIDVGAGLARLL